MKCRDCPRTVWPDEELCRECEERLELTQVLLPVRLREERDESEVSHERTD